MTAKSIPLKKRHLSYSESNSSCLPDKSSPPVDNPDSSSLIITPSNPTNNKNVTQPITTTLPSKKRWLLANIAENPSKKRVSLTDYLKRKHGGHDNSDSDLSIDLDGVKPSDSNNGVLSDLPIQSLEERKKELQKALFSMEERRKQHGNPTRKGKREQHDTKHKKQNHKHHHHNKKDNNAIKEINKKQIKDFSHFVKKQEKRLKSRQEAKSGTTNDSSNSNGLTSTVNQFKLINENLKLEIQKLKAQQVNNNNNNNHNKSVH